MLRLFIVAAILVFTHGAADAESKRGALIRRLTLAASCASSFWDLSTTRTALHYGALETNGPLADAQGRARWGRMIGIKVGLCAGMAFSQEILTRNRASGPDTYIWTGVNAATTSAFAAAALHNRKVAGELKTTPAYLLRN